MSGGFGLFSDVRATVVDFELLDKIALLIS
jgi:hypothetical protein